MSFKSNRSGSSCQESFQFIKAKTNAISEYSEAEAFERGDTLKIIENARRDLEAVKQRNDSVTAKEYVSMLDTYRKAANSTLQRTSIRFSKQLEGSQIDEMIMNEINNNMKALESDLVVLAEIMTEFNGELKKQEKGIEKIDHQVEEAAIETSPGRRTRGVIPETPEFAQTYTPQSPPPKRKRRCTII
ncbi:hypothetical protein PROFUN_04293 [Planoprotostelium fungivorum]|uniref:t-SNARE coiled-coil homology domain-containing protein n=1 Tax=Planoprotostelium fungivorum TaxID=1890364 RepID=A0A2P6NV28_9EUKA|nr:hypothetical protein PROFUN_04293 [Planoprotostelium fungivorum]